METILERILILKGYEVSLPELTISEIKALIAEIS